MPPNKAVVMLSVRIENSLFMACAPKRTVFSHLSAGIDCPLMGVTGHDQLTGRMKKSALAFDR